MKILQIVPRLPYPADTGGKIDILNFARVLSPSHEISLIGFVEEIPSKECLQFLKQYYTHVDTVPFQRDSFLRKAMLGIFGSTPYAIQKYYSIEMVQKLKQAAERIKFDIIRIDMMHMAHYDFCFPNQPVLLRKQNVDTIIMKRMFEVKNRLDIKIYAYLQWKKLISFERIVSQRFRRCVMISRDDENELKRICPFAITSVIPCSVQMNLKPLEINSSGRNKRVTFLGSMDWLPNEDAVNYFAKEIWPLIRKQIPDIEFYIVGRFPTARVNRLSKIPGIYVTGYVESVTPYLEKTDVFVVPLRIGSGVRIKILEVMSLGIPIVSTLVGAEGINIVSGRELLIADQAEQFANAVIQILRNPDLSKHLSDNSRKLVEQNYSNRVVKELWEQLLEYEVSASLE